MNKQDSRRAQIASIADAEPIGSVLFYTHVGLLLVSAFGTYALFGRVEFIPVCAFYAFLLTVEKKSARFAANSGNLSLYPAVLGLLFVRSVVFNVIVLLVWRLEGDVYKMAALALLLSATINIMVFHATYIAIMVCVVVPITLSFATIAATIVMEENGTAASIGAIFVFVGIVPYFGLSLSAARKRWQELISTKGALEQAQRLDAIGRVASGVSHDFNNVLGVIAGNLHLLESERDPHEKAALIKSANEAVEGGASLSRQLLTMGKKQPLMPETVSLNATIDTFTAFCRNVFPASIHVNVRSGPDDPTVYADPNLLQSALLNLALNAKAAMKDSGTLTIRYGFEQRRRSQAPTHAFVSVADTGIGMSEEAIERSFEPFYSTKSAEGGSGLGLPMVKGFVEQSKGRIDLESREGKGTTATLYLPVSTAQPQQTGQAIAKASVIAGKEKSFRIVLVEDNREMRKILRIMLEKLGYDVVAFETADMAAAYLSKDSTVRLVLCDFDLPGELQGDDLLALVKSKHNGTRFILMSGFAPTEKFSDEGSLSKADLFLPKPLQLADLKSKIEGLLVTA